jgi:ABC-type amino acid transport substrate-binding protein
LSVMAPLKLRKIGLVSPYTMSSDHPTVVFSSSVRLEWQFGGRDVGEVAYRVHFDTQKNFQSGQARQASTRLTNYVLPVDFPHGPVFWRVEAIARDGQVQATSDVGMFEFYADSIDRIRHTGLIRVGVACSSQGEFAYFDEQQNRLTGYDIELTRWLAAQLLPDMPTVRPIFLGYNWNKLLNSVSRNEVDFIISTITITSEREEEFGLKFSHPYYRTKQAFVVLKDSGIRSTAELRGRRLAVQMGTTSEPVGEAFTEPAKLVRVANADIAYEALLKGQVEAVITDYDFAQGEVRKLGRPAAVIALQENDFPENYSGVRSEKYGIAVAKPETNLLTRLNNAIDLATNANVLETLKLRFVTGEHGTPQLQPLPNPEVAMPSFELWPRPAALRR